MDVEDWEQLADKAKNEGWLNAGEYSVNLPVPGTAVHHKCSESTVATCINGS